MKAYMIDMNRMNQTELLVITELMRKEMITETHELMSTPIPKTDPIYHPAGDIVAKKLRYITVEVPHELHKRRKGSGKKYVALQRILNIIEAKPNKVFKFRDLADKIRLIGGNQTWVKDQLINNKGLMIEKLINRHGVPSGKILVSKQGLEANPKESRKTKHDMGARDIAIAKIAELVKSSPGKIFTFPKLFRKFKIADGNWTYVKHTLAKTDGIMLVKSGKGWKISAQAEKPALKEHHYMHQKSEYQKFASQRIKYHMQHDRMDYLSACRMVSAEWKPKRQVSVARTEFPQITSIKLEFLPILRDILSNLITTPNSTMDYNSVAYTLGLSNVKQYLNLVTEILNKTEEIMSYFGLENNPHRFVSENYNLSWK